VTVTAGPGLRVGGRDEPVPASAPPGGAALAVPRARSVAEALLAPAIGGPTTEELERLRAELGRDLQAVAGDLPGRGGLRLDTFRMRLARRHPEACLLGDEPFTPSPRACRRAVGSAAVRACVRGRAGAPAAAVAEVLAAGAAEADVPGAGAPWWASWYTGLSAAARAVVHAEALSWATAVFGAVDWTSLPRVPVIGGTDDWWSCPGPRPVVLRGRVDVGVPDGRRLAFLVVGSGHCPDDWRAELGFPGLVGALARSAEAAPSRVVGVWPDSGQWRVLDLDIATLRAAAVAVVSAAATWVDACLERAQPGHRPGGRGPAGRD